MIVSTVNATIMQGSFEHGKYFKRPESPGGYYCEYSQAGLCNVWEFSEAGGVLVDFVDISIPGKVRVVFGASWGATYCEVDHPTLLPPALATYFGLPQAYLVPAIYPITITPMYPNGYIDMNITP